MCENATRLGSQPLRGYIAPIASRSAARPGRGQLGENGQKCSLIRSPPVRRIGLPGAGCGCLPRGQPTQEMLNLPQNMLNREKVAWENPGVYPLELCQITLVFT